MVMLAGLFTLVACSPEPEVVTEEIEVVPTACGEALDLADETILGLRELLGWYEETGGNASRAMLDGEDIEEMIELMEQQNEDIERMTDRIQVEAFETAATECRQAER